MRVCRRVLRRIIVLRWVYQRAEDEAVCKLRKREIRSKCFGQKDQYEQTMRFHGTLFRNESNTTAGQRITRHPPACSAWMCQPCPLSMTTAAVETATAEVLAAPEVLRPAEMLAAPEVLASQCTFSHALAA